MDGKNAQESGKELRHAAATLQSMLKDWGKAFGSVRKFLDPEAKRKEYERAYVEALVQDILHRVQVLNVSLADILSQELISTIPEEASNPMPLLGLSIIQLESIRIDLLSVEELDTQLAFVEKRYAAFASLPNSLKIPVPDTRAAEKRAWLRQTLWEGYRVYNSNYNKHAELGRHIFRFANMIVLILLIVFYLFLFMNNSTVTFIVPTFLLAMLAGALGGSINHLRQLASPKRPRGADILSYELELIAKSALATTISGSVFGLVIYVIAASGIAKALGDFGNLLPQIDDVILGDTNQTTLISTSHGLLPLFMGRPQTVEVAKLMVWCFASGFVPNLVPDLVESIYGRTKERPEPK